MQPSTPDQTRTTVRQAYGAPESVPVACCDTVLRETCCKPADKPACCGASDVIETCGCLDAAR
jgi:hypothetical protein